MPRLITGFTFALSADSREFYAEMRRVSKAGTPFERSLARLQTTLRRTATRIQAFTKNLFSVRGALTALAGGGVIGNLVKRATDLGAALVEASSRAGLGVEDYQALQRVFEGDGVSASNFEKAIQRLQRSITDASQGSTTYLRAFEALGVSIRNNDGSLRSVRDVLLDVAEAFPQLTSETERAGIAQQLFGTRAAGFINVLGRGREALIDNINEMRDLGVVSGANATVLKALAQDFTDLTNIIRTNFANAVAAAASSIRDVIERVEEASISALPNLTTAGIAFASALTRVSENLGIVVTGIAAVRLSGFVSSIGAAIAATTSLGAAWTTAGAAIAAWSGPVGWITLAIAGIVTFRKEINDLLSNVDRAAEAEDRLRATFGLTGDSVLERYTNAERQVNFLIRRQNELREAIERVRTTESQHSLQRGRGSADLRRLEGDLEATTKLLGEQRDALARARTAWLEFQDATARAREDQGAAAGITAIGDATSAANAVAQASGGIFNDWFDVVSTRAREVAARLEDVRNALLDGATAAEMIRTAAAAPFDTIREKAREFNLVMNDVRGEIAGVRFDLDSAGSAQDRLNIALAEGRNLNRQQAVLTAQYNDALERGEDELADQYQLQLDIIEAKRIALGLTKEQIEALEDLVEKEKEAAEGADDNKDKWAEFKRIGTDALRRVGDALSNLIINAESFGDALKRIAVILATELAIAAVLTALGVETRQQGGPVQAGRPYVVGEAGPELIVPSRSGYVIPNSQLAGGGFNPQFNLTVPDESVARIARDEIRREFPSMLRQVRGMQIRDRSADRG